MEFGGVVEDDLRGGMRLGMEMGDMGNSMAQMVVEMHFGGRRNTEEERIRESCEARGGTRRRRGGVRGRRA